MLTAHERWMAWGAVLLSTVATPMMMQSIVVRPATVELQLQVQNFDDAPWAGQSIRVVIGAAPGWQSIGAGTVCTTDAKGHCTVRVDTDIDEPHIKMPTNFWSSLTARKQRTRHLQVAVELPYLNAPWLSAMDINYFDDGTMLHAGASRVFGRSPNGDFATETPIVDGRHQGRTSDGMVFSLPGFDVSRFTFEPADASGTRWKATLWLKLWRPPVRR